MIELLNPLSLEYLGALRHLSGVMDVMYVDQLSLAWGILGHALSQYLQIWWVFTPIIMWPHFVQKKVPNKRTLKYQEIGVIPLYLPPILHSFYTIRYMVSFWCGNTLLEGDFKNTKTYQNMYWQPVVRSLSF